MVQQFSIMKKQNHGERSGVVRCQRCLKYGHYTYECENEVVYRYRPSPTVMYKEKIRLQLNQDKGPKTNIKNPDYKRAFIEDIPSSDEEQPLVELAPKAISSLPAQPQVEETVKAQLKEVEVINKNQEAVQADESDSSSSSSSSSQSSSSSSSSSSNFTPEQKPKKKRKI